MKVIAMYLPQFHRVKENDEWWGEGFTDWIAARKAQKLYEKHYQPHIPLNDNYYDLLDKKTMQWQAEMMHKYGVDGVCMYHYWFEKGKRILEKPAENLLAWTDIDMPFCFSWANETWARSWSKIQGANSWAENFEQNVNGEKKAVLLKQEYGTVEDWREHFEYLLPFFKDQRYIKIEDKPVIMIYKTDMIECLNDMLLYWRKWAKDSGFSDIYVIGGSCKKRNESYVDARICTAPGDAIENYFTYTSRKNRMDYADVWNVILSQADMSNVYYEGFVGYDTTPRRGGNGFIVENSTPELFGKYLTKLMAKNEKNQKDITFINAWNEWGEGMHLEPDELNQYKYLEQINNAKENYKHIKIQENFNEVYVRNLQQKAEKYEQYFTDLYQWIISKENGDYLDEYLYELGIKTVAIYGYGIMGKYLRRELEDSKIECKYIVDIQKNIQADIDIYSPSEELPAVDAIIISAYYYASEINLNCTYPVIALNELIYRTYEKTDIRKG